MLAKSWNRRRRLGSRSFVITWLVLSPPLGALWLNTMRPPPEKLHFQCAKCQHTFTKTGQELEKLMPEALMPEMGLLQFDCPKCKAKASALMQIKCPACGKYYLSPPMVASAKAVKEAREAAVKEGKDPNTAVPTLPPAAEQVKDICPHCKTDRVQWYINYYKKKT